MDKMVEEDDHEFEVTVLGVGDCNWVKVEFRQEDEAAIKQVTGADGTTYNALNYHKILFQTGQKLLIKIRKLTDDEITSCNTFVATDPGIFLVSFTVN